MRWTTPEWNKVIYKAARILAGDVVPIDEAVITAARQELPPERQIDEIPHRFPRYALSKRRIRRMAEFYGRLSPAEIKDREIADLQGKLRDAKQEIEEMEQELDDAVVDDQEDEQTIAELTEALDEVIQQRDALKEQLDTSGERAWLRETLDWILSDSPRVDQVHSVLVSRFLDLD